MTFLSLALVVVANITIEGLEAMFGEPLVLWSILIYLLWQRWRARP